MDKRTTPWALTRNEAAFLGAIVGYAIVVVVVTPLLLGFLPILAVGWMLRVPVAWHPADRPALQIDAEGPLNPVAKPTEPVGQGATTPVSTRSSASA